MGQIVIDTKFTIEDRVIYMERVSSKTVCECCGHVEFGEWETIDRTGTIKAYGTTITPGFTPDIRYQVEPDDKTLPFRTYYVSESMCRYADE